MGQEEAPPASVIVRAKDKAATIERVLRLLRGQTVRPEIIVVDSGSTDGTREIARGLSDRLLEISPEEFTYGRAINLGAAVARAPIHFAVSAHCFPTRPDWIERALAHYEHDRVAGACGYERAPDGSCGGVVHQDAALFHSNPFWGFSNHASSWRASVWERFPFDEEIAGSEDKEWSWRVLEAGYVIALDPALDVGTLHRFQSGLLDYYRRHRRDTAALASFAGAAPLGTRGVLSEWWNPEPDGVRSQARLRLSPWRAAGLLGREAGLRHAAGRRP